MIPSLRRTALKVMVMRKTVEMGLLRMAAMSQS
jgi:hypothetical protein